MKFVMVGLGNPGAEYENTRHNTGRIILDEWRRLWGWPDWTLDKKKFCLATRGEIGKHEALLLLPETFMNKSGQSVGAVVKNQAAAKRLLVVHDDLDLPLGRFKLSFGRGDGGHKGAASVRRAVKTKDFLRLRVGVAGKKKPSGEAAVVKFILGRFSPEEQSIIKKLAQASESLLKVWMSEGLEAALNQFNAAGRV